MREWRGTYRQAEVRLPPGFEPPSAALVTSRPPAPAPQVRSTLLARQYDRVGGPSSGEMAERIAAPIPPITAACSDCRTVTELEAGRCAYCAELDALRWKRRPWAAGRMAVAAVVAVVLVAVLFVGVLIGLGMSGL